MRGQRRRGFATQAGFTLIEVLLVVALSAVIFAPLMLWVGLAVNQQPIIKDGILRTASAGLLGSYFPKDVAVAGQATVAFNADTPPWAADCVAAAVAGAGASTAGGGGKRQVAMIAGGSDVYKVIYSAAPAAADPAKQSLWRRTCNAATNLLITSTEVFADIQPGSTVATCTSELGDKPCRQIKISVTPTSTGRVVTVQGTRRVDEGALPTDLTGAAAPTAIIQVTSQAGSPLVVGLSAARSSVGSGRTAQYKWEVSGPSSVSPQPSSTAKQISATLGKPGSYSVILTVTDDLGRINYAYQQIRATNQAPTAVAVVTPASGASGTVFTLDGSGSSDPDGDISAYDWIVEYPSVDGVAAGVQITTTGSVTSVTPPAGVFGTASVTLIVTDDQGAQGSTYRSFELTDPSGPTTTVGPGGSTTTTLNPAGPSALSVSFTNVPGSGAFGQTFNASATTGIGAGNTASYRWEFGDGKSETSVIPVVHTYPNDGQYNVRVTATTSDGRTATTARVVNVGGAAPAPAPRVVDDTRLVWDAVPGARRYLADFEWRTDTDCFKQLVDQSVAVSPAPSKAIPANRCSSFATSRARVGTDANGTVSWSEWIKIPLVKQ
jgi:prepilin-type N-terminal cleavage/methylation domain-containing protein